MDENPPNCGYPHGDCVLSAYIDDLTAQIAQAAPVLAAAEEWAEDDYCAFRMGHIRDAVAAWRAAREG